MSKGDIGLVVQPDELCKKMLIGEAAGNREEVKGLGNSIASSQAEPDESNRGAMQFMMAYEAQEQKTLEFAMPNPGQGEFELAWHDVWNANPFLPCGMAPPTFGKPPMIPPMPNYMPELFPTVPGYMPGCMLQAPCHIPLDKDYQPGCRLYEPAQEARVV